MFQSFGIIGGEGRPSCKGPIGLRTALICLKSCKSLQFPNFFFITNTGEFHGLVENSDLFNWSCCWTNVCKTARFSLFRGHWSTQTGTGIMFLCLWAFLKSLNTLLQSACLRVPCGSIYFLMYLWSWAKSFLEVFALRFLGGHRVTLSNPPVYLL